MIYSPRCWHNSHIQVIQCRNVCRRTYMIYTQRSTCVHTHAQRILRELLHRAENQLLTQPPAYFRGSKALTFVCSCAGACTKNVPVNSVWDIWKTNADFIPPKNILDTYIRNALKGTNRFFLRLQSDEICCVPEMKQEAKNDVFSHLKVSCWGDSEGKDRCCPLVNLNADMFICFGKRPANYLSKNVHQ